ncbi:hypothetical protein SpCBS45565_g06549 [Spizellomyces sp. 'palustris']|nr:hypothetical protein SpCBS45565_g06549 [Spizellomyces sp. 'palustris']
MQPSGGAFHNEPETKHDSFPMDDFIKADINALQPPYTKIQPFSGDEQNQTLAQNDDEAGSRWEQAEERFLELFFGKERGLGKGRFDYPQRLSKVSFDLTSNVHYGPPIHLIDESDDLASDCFATPSSSNRIIRPRTADLSQEQKIRLNAFRELDELVFLRPPSATTGRRLGSASAETVLHGDKGRRIMSARRATMVGGEPLDDLFLPRTKRPLSRETKSLFFKVIADIFRTAWTSPSVVPDPTTLQHSDRHLAPAADHALVPIGATGGTAGPKVYVRLPPQLGLHRVPSYYFDEEDGHIMVSHIAKQYPLPKLGRFPKRLTPSPSRIESRMEGCRGVNILKMREEQMEEEHINEARPTPADVIQWLGDEVPHTIPSILSTEQKEIDQHYASHPDRPISRPGRRLGHTFAIDFFMDHEDAQQQLVDPLSTQSDKAGVRTKGRAPGTQAPSGPDTPDPALAPAIAWHPCTVLSYDPAENRYTIKWEEPLPERRNPPTQLTRADILLPRETPNAHHQKLVHAHTIRVEFEYRLALRQCVAIARPFLKDYIADAPVRASERLLAEELRKRRRERRQWTKFICGTTIGKADEAGETEEEEDESLTFAPEVLINLRAEIQNDYTRSQIEAALLCSGHLQRFLPQPLKIPTLSESHWQDERIRVTSSVNGQVARLAALLYPRIEFYRQKCNDVVFYLRNECQRLLKDGINDFLRRGEIPYDSEDPNTRCIFFTPKEFVEACAHIHGGFVQTVSEYIGNVLSAAVTTAFREHQVEPRDSPETLLPTMETQDAETARSLLKFFVAVIAKSTIMPIFRTKITDIYKSFHQGAIRIRVDLVFDWNADYSITFSIDFESWKSALKKSLSCMLTPVTCKFPTGPYIPTPEDHVFLKELCAEMIDEGINSCRDFVNWLSATILPRVRSASHVSVLDVDVANSAENVLIKCDAQLRDISIVEKHGAGLAKVTPRGMFAVFSEKFQSEIKEWVSKTRRRIFAALEGLLDRKVQDIHDVYTTYTTHPPAGNFDQTKSACVSLQSLDAALPLLQGQTSFVKSLKSFLDERQWAVDDELVTRFYDAYTMYDRLTEFAALRKRAVSEAIERLRAVVEKEMCMIVELWDGVEAALDKVLTTPIGEATSSSGADDEEHEEEEDRTEDDEHEDARAQNHPTTITLKSLTPISKHIVNALDIATVIIRKASCIDDAQRLSQLQDLLLSMHIRRTLVTCLLQYREDLDRWRYEPICSIHASDVRKRCAELLEVFTPSGIAHPPIAQHAAKEIAAFLETEYPIVEVLTYDSFRSWHWDSVRNALGFADFDITTTPLSLVTKTIGRRNLGLTYEDLLEILQEAEQEQSLSRTLSEIQNRFAQLSIQITRDEATGLSVINRFERLIGVIESDLLSVELLLEGSDPGIEHYVDQFTALQHDLQKALKSLTEWSKTQPLLLSTHSFFNATEVQLALPLETKRYRAVETTYRALLAKAEKNLGMKALVDAAPDLAEGLTEMRGVLGSLVEDVQGWLDGKRIGFPRLFFGADEELLELVKVKREPKELNGYLSKYFYFTSLIHQPSASAAQDHKITGIRSTTSGTSEALIFRNFINTSHLSIEELLSKIETQIQSTLKEMIFTVLRNKNSDEDGEDVPEQIRVLAHQVRRTLEVEDNLGIKGGLEALLSQTVDKIRKLTTRSDKLAKILLTLTLSDRDWIQRLLNAQRTTEDMKTSLEWLNALKYHYDEDEVTVTISQDLCHASYGFEYIPPTARLALGISSRTFINIWPGLISNHGILTHGPPDTGKTTLLLEFTQTLGRFAVVCCCSPAVSSAIMRRLLTGMVLTGCFLVFRQLERLGPDSLGVFLAGIEAVRELTAATSRKELSSVSFLGRVMKLPPVVHVRCFATSEKMDDDLFRGTVRNRMVPIALRLPGAEIVAAVLLRNASFKDAESYAAKVAAFWRGCEGLGIRMGSVRSVMSVCRYMGRMRDNFDELEVVARCLWEWGLLKAVGEEVGILRDVLGAVFGSTSLAICTGSPGNIRNDTVTPDWSPLQMHLKNAINGLLTATSIPNTHVLVLGAPQTGKTTTIRAASHFKSMPLYTINPSALSSALLSGSPSQTGSTKGILEDLASNPNPSWIHLDGPYSSSWTEAVASLMHPSALCLSTGKRLMLPQQVTLIWEAEDIHNVSAGFISRFTLLHMKTKWTWEVSISEWIYQIPKDPNLSPFATTLQCTLEAVFGIYMKELVSSLDEICRLRGMDLQSSVSTFLGILQCLLVEACLEKDCEGVIEDVFWYAVVWSFGLAVDVEHRTEFEGIICRLLEGNQSSSQLWAVLQSQHEGSGLFLLVFNTVTRSWTPSPTHSVISHIRSLASTLLQHHKSVLFTGGPSAGKTFAAERTLASLPEQKTIIHTHMLHPTSTPEEFHVLLHKTLVKDEATAAYVPANNKTLTLFVDDLHVPMSAPPSSPSPVAEFWRSFPDMGGYWSNDTTFRSVGRISILGCSELEAPPHRLVRHFIIFKFHDADAYCEMRESFLEYMHHRGNKVDMVIDATLRCHDLIKLRIQRSGIRLFVPSDAAKVLRGLMKISEEDWISSRSLKTAWCFEVDRVYLDRISPSDTSIYHDIIGRVCLQYFHQTAPSSGVSYLYSDMTTMAVRPNERDANRSIFTLGFSPSVRQSTVSLIQAAYMDRVAYREVSEELIKEAISIFTAQGDAKGLVKSDITLYPGAIDHFCRLDRVLGDDQYPSALLIGHCVHDVQKDLAKLASAMRGYRFREYNVIGPIHTPTWRLFIRKQIIDAAISLQKVVVGIFLPAECALNPAFLGDLNALLDRGRSAQLWTAGEYDDMLSKIAHQAKQTERDGRGKISRGAGLGLVKGENRKALSALDVERELNERTLTNLKIVVCVDMANRMVLDQLAEYPKIISSLTTDIYYDYNETSLRTLAQNYFSDSGLLEAVNDESTSAESLSTCAAQMFLAVIHAIKCGSHPFLKSMPINGYEKFLEHVSEYYMNTKNELISQNQKFRRCLTKVGDARELVKTIVDNTRSQLQNLPALLESTTAQLNVVTKQLKDKQMDVEQLRKELKSDEENIDRQWRQKQQDAADACLGAARQNLELSIRRLQALRKDAFEELKAETDPPPPVQFLASAICILFDKPQSWTEARKVIASHSFIFRISSLTADTLQEAVLDKLKKIVEEPTFRPDRCAVVGIAARELCAWVQTLYSSSREVRRVKEEQSQGRLNTAKRVVGSANAHTRLSKSRDKLIESAGECAKLQQQYSILASTKRELVGRIALVREIFSPTSIFDAHEPGHADHISESQWMQQAFHCEDNTPVFENPKVASAHSDYQTALYELKTLRERLASDVEEGEKQLTGIRDLFESLKMEDIEELLEPADNPYVSQARASLLDLLQLPAHSTPTVVYDKLRSCSIETLPAPVKQPTNTFGYHRPVLYDKNVAASTAITPFVASRAAITVSNILPAIRSFKAKHQRIMISLREAEEVVKQKKAVFDEKWSAVYAGRAEFWSFEVIVNTIKDIRRRLEIADLTLIKLHLTAANPNPLLVRIIKVGCALVGWNADFSLLAKWVMRNPTLFVREIANVKIGDLRVKELIQSGLEGDNLICLRAIAVRQVNRLYVDIVGALPCQLGLKVLSFVDYKTLARGSSVNRKWADLLADHEFWKWMSYRRGWGVAFVYPKDMDWKVFYFTLANQIEKRTNLIESSVKANMGGLLGIKAYAKLTAFLKRLPEYVQLSRNGRQSANQLDSVIQLEVTNDVFIAAERAFSEYLAEYGTSSTDVVLPIKQPGAKHSPLRHRKAFISLRAATGLIFPSKEVHELIMIRARKSGLLHPTIERLRKQPSQLRGVALITVDVNIPGTVREALHTWEPPVTEHSRASESIFTLLAEMFQATCAFHDGKKTGKYLQFQDRFIKSLQQLSKKIQSRIDALGSRKESLLANTLMRSGLFAYFGPLSDEKRVELQDIWRRLIKQHINGHADNIPLTKDTRIPANLALFKVNIVRQNLNLMNATKHDKWLIDPNGLAKLILEQYGYLKSEGSEADRLDARRPDFVEQLSKLKGSWKPIWIEGLTSKELGTEILKFQQERLKELRMGITQRSPLVVFADAGVASEPMLDKFQVVNFTHCETTLRSLLFDLIMSTATPSFHQQRKSMQMKLSSKKHTSESSFDACITMMETCSITDSEDLMHDIILFQREGYLVESMTEAYKSFKSDILHQYKPFMSLATFGCELHTAFKRIKLLNSLYAADDQIFTQTFNDCLRNEVSTLKAPALSDSAVNKVANALTQQTMIKVNDMLREEDRIPVHFALAIVNARRRGPVSRNEVNLLEKVLGCLNDNGAEELNTTTILSQLDRWPDLHEFLTTATQNAECAAYDFFETTSATNVWSRRLTNMEKFVATLIIRPDMLKPVLVDMLTSYGLLVEDSSSDQFTRLQGNHCMVLIVTDELADTQRLVVQACEDYEGAQTQITVVTEEDKRGDKWKDKVSHAAENGDWLVIHADAYWISQLKAIVYMVPKSAGNFRLWFLCPAFVQEMLPADVPTLVRVCFHEKNLSFRHLAKHFCKQYLVRDNKQPLPVDRLYYSVIYGHVGLVVTARRPETMFSKIIHFNDVDFDLSIALMAEARKRGLPPAIYETLILESVYLKEAAPRYQRKRVESVRSSVLAILDEYVKPSELDVVNYENFEKSFDNDQHLSAQKSLDSKIGVGTVNCHWLWTRVSEKLQLLLDCPCGPSLETSGVSLSMLEKDFINQMGTFWRTLPRLPSVRQLYESASGVQNGRTLFLREAARYNLVFRHVKQGLRGIISGCDTYESRHILKIVTTRRIPHSWCLAPKHLEYEISSYFQELGIAAQFFSRCATSNPAQFVSVKLPISVTHVVHAAMMRYCKAHAVPLERVKCCLEFHVGSNEIDRLQVNDTLSESSFILTDLLLRDVRMQNEAIDAIALGCSSIISPLALRLYVKNEGAPTTGASEPPATNMMSEYETTVPAKVISDSSVSVHLHKPENSLPDLSLRTRVSPSDLYLHGVTALCSSEPFNVADLEHLSELNWGKSHFLASSAGSAPTFTRYVTVYLCSTPDTENEREYFYSNILTQLQQKMLRKHILLHVVDFRAGHPSASLSELDYVQATRWQIRRADIFLSIIGSKVGNSSPDRSLDVQGTMQVYSKLWEMEIDCALGLPVQNSSSIFYFRDAAFTRSVPKSFRSLYEPENSKAIERVEKLKQQLSESRCPVHIYQSFFSRIEGRRVKMGGLEAWGLQVAKDITQCIDLRDFSFGPTVPVSNLTDFSGRAEVLQHVRRAFLSLDNNAAAEGQISMENTLLLHGKSGMGKTTLLGKICSEFQADGFLVLTNFVRTWYGSFDISQMLRRFQTQLSKHFEAERIDVGTGTSEQNILGFATKLRKAAKLGTNVLIIVDGVDRLSISGSKKQHDFSWLPSIADVDNQTLSRVRWLFSAADETVLPALRKRHPDTKSWKLEGLTNQEQKDILRMQCLRMNIDVEHRQVQSILAKMNLSKPLYLALLLKKIKRTEFGRTFSNMDIPVDVASMFDQMLNEFEQIHGRDVIAGTLTAIASSRSGLREVEIIELLKLSFLDWNLICESLKDLLAETESGHLIPFHEEFTTAIKKRYIRSPADLTHQHRLLAMFYASTCVTVCAGQQQWRKYDAHRAVDIVHHQLTAGFPPHETARVLCNLGFIESAFVAGVGYEVVGFIAELLKRAQTESDHELITRLGDFNLFVETYGQYLRLYPKMCFTLAYNLPKGVCPSVRQDARTRNNRAHGESLLECITPSESHAESIIVATEATKLIAVTVQVQKAIGRCCLTVSDEGTVKAWDIDSYLLTEVLLQSPFPAASAVACCFSLNGAERVAIALRNKDICLYNLSSGNMIAFVESSYRGGAIFFSESLESIWQSGLHTQLECIDFDAEALNKSAPQLDRGDDALDVLDAEMPPTQTKSSCDAIIAHSIDGHRIATYSRGNKGVIVFNAVKMREICRFNEELTSATSVGAFSLGRDLLAVTRIDGGIMIWRIDNHSRCALIHAPADTPIQCLSFSADETLLFCGTPLGVITVAEVETGRWIKRVNTGASCLTNMCLSTSRGKERFLLSSENRLLVCNTHNWKNEGKIAPLMSVSDPHHTKDVSHLEFIRGNSTNSGLSLISSSSDGTYIIWSIDVDFTQVRPITQTTLPDQPNSVHVSKMENYLASACGNLSVVFDLHSHKESLRILHSSRLRRVTLSRLKIEHNGLCLYTWGVNGTFTAWQLLRRADRTLTYHQMPLFQRHCTALPSHLFSPDGTRVAIANGNCIYVVDPHTGHDLQTFETWEGECVQDLCWSVSHHIIYCSASSVWVNGEIWSSGGSQGDNIQIQECRSHKLGKLFAYSAVEVEEQGDIVNHTTSQDVGLIVVMRLDKPWRHCLLRHESGRIVSWSFMDNPRYIVTIATDHIVRVWDIGLASEADGQPDHNGKNFVRQARANGEICAMVPLASQPTSLAVGANQRSIVVGTVDGQVLVYLIRTPH